MSFLSKRTPLFKVKKEDDSPLRPEHSSLDWEHFKCEKHSQLQIQALHHSKATNTFNLVCVKCIIEGDFFTTDDGDESITIKELLDACEETIASQKNPFFNSPENLQEKFVGFLVKDYPGTYEKHIEAQADLIDKEIEETIEKLTLVREKYRKYFSKQLDIAKKQGEEIKDEINTLLETETDKNSSKFSSMKTIYKEIDRIDNQEDLLTLFSELYMMTKEKKGDRKPIDDCFDLLEKMDDFKEKVLSVKNKEVNVSRFESMRKNLDSLMDSDSLDFKSSVGAITKKLKLDKKRETRIETKMEVEPVRSSRYFDSYPLSEIQNLSEPDSPSYSPSPSPQLKKEEAWRPPKRKSVVKKAKEEKENDDDDENEPVVKKRGRKKIPRDENETEIGSHSLRNLKKALAKNEESEEPLSPGGRRKLVVAALSDWVNRRITGYLIFQNTMNTDPDLEKEAGIAETGVHLNQSTGKKWKSLSEDEREEFKDVAKEFRKEFKQKIEDYDDLENTNELIEELDAEIKKLRRE